MSEKNEVVVYEATQIWSSVEYGNGLHKGSHFFVRMCDYDAVVAQRDELLVALKDCLGRLQWLNDPRTGNTEKPWIKTAEAAIAKAEQQS